MMKQSIVRPQTPALMLILACFIFSMANAVHAEIEETFYAITGYKMNTLTSNGNLDTAVLTLDTVLPDNQLLIWPFLFQGTDATAKVIVHFNNTPLTSFTHEDFAEGYWNYLYIDIQQFVGQTGELRLTLESQNTPVSLILVEDARKTDGWPGYFSGTAPAAGLQLPLNNIGEFNETDGQIYTCLAITNNNLPSDVGGVPKFDIAFAIVSLEQGLIKVVNNRPFNPTNALTDSGETPSCSGRFEALNNLYTDTVFVKPQTFKVTFKLIDGDTLTLQLLSAEELQ